MIYMWVLRDRGHNARPIHWEQVVKANSASTLGERENQYIKPGFHYPS